jgi:hypothetical protein
MTIPFSLPFGRRLVLSLDIVPSAPGAPLRARRGPKVPAALEATDAELARINARSSVAEDRRRWEAQAVFLGFRP